MKYNVSPNNINDFVLRIFTIMVFGTLSLYSTSVHGQTRPYDNTEIKLVNKGGLQSDSYFNKSNMDFYNIQGLSTMLRYGLSKNFELQIEWGSKKYKYKNSNLTSTTEATTLGLKVHLTEDSRFLPALSAILTTNLTFDTSDRIFYPSLNILFEKAITSSFNVNGNFELKLDEQKGDVSTNYAINLEADITNWQTTYIGITADGYSSLEGIQKSTYLEMGMLFYVYDGIVLYPYYDIGLSDGSSDIFNIGALFTLGK